MVPQRFREAFRRVDHDPEPPAAPVIPRAYTSEAARILDFAVERERTLRQRALLKARRHGDLERL